MRFIFINLLCLFINLWITTTAFAWGAKAHIIIAKLGTSVVSDSTRKNCAISVEDLIRHTNDPDEIWKDLPRQHPNEKYAHFFHLDHAIENLNLWQIQVKPLNDEMGFLPFRIYDWIRRGRQERSEKRKDSLRETLFGLSHYIADLTQPLHLHHDFDGQDSGLKGIHEAFETRLISNHQKLLYMQTEKNLRDFHSNQFLIWRSLPIEVLIKNVAIQSSAKAPNLITLYKQKRRSKKHLLPIATEQLTLASELWAFILTQLCN